MLVFDTSAFINGSRLHLPMATFPSVWDLVSDAMADGRIVSPREAYNELKARDDDLFRWAKDRQGAFVEPSSEVQAEAGAIAAMLPSSPTRDVADPWVIAEAKVRSFTVITYEGQSFSGERTRKWHAKMPGICQELDVPCATLPEGLAFLGGSF